MDTKVHILDESAKNSNASSVKIFSNPEFGKVRMVVIEDEPWFVGKDVANILGYANPSESILEHTDREDRKSLKYKAYSESLLSTLWQGNDFSDKMLINESGIYSLILRSNLEKAKRFKRWVTSEVLPSIRRTGSYKTAGKASIPEVSSPKEFMEVSMIYLSALNKELRLSDASVASYGNKCAKMVGIPELDYVPSKGVKFSATALLKQFDRKENINFFNQRMEELGYLETKERKSTSSKTGFKRFKCLTDKGLEFGENMVSPHNEKETQPHYYEDKFPGLLKILFG